MHWRVYGAVPGPLIVHRIADINAPDDSGRASLLEVVRIHTSCAKSKPGILDFVAADKGHRVHPNIEHVFADIKRSGLAHVPSCRFAANGTRLALASIAFNLTRAPGAIAAC